MTRTYTVVLENESVGGYSVYVPAIPGCFTEGDTIADSLAMAREAIELMLECALDHGEPIPPDKRVFKLDVRSTAAALVRRVQVTVPEAAKVA